MSDLAIALSAIGLLLYFVWWLLLKPLPVKPITNLSLFQEIDTMTMKAKVTANWTPSASEDVVGQLVEAMVDAEVVHSSEEPADIHGLLVPVLCLPGAVVSVSVTAITSVGLRSETVTETITIPELVAPLPVTDMSLTAAAVEGVDEES